MPASVRLVLVLVLGAGACGCGPAPGVRVEGKPAPPCSVNGMLFRDTPAETFEQCGRTSDPIDEEVADCTQAAIEAKRAFVAQLETARPTPAHLRPALVGAQFGGRYELRIYSEGERTPVELVRSSATRPSLSMLPTLAGRIRCVQSDAPPDPTDSGWRDLDDEGLHKLHAGECLEWFDEAAWQRQPWTLRYDASARVDCSLASR